MDINGNKQPQNNTRGERFSPTSSSTAPARKPSDEIEQNSYETPSQGPPPFRFDQNKGRGRKLVTTILITLLLLGLAAAAGYFYWQNDQTTDELNRTRADVSTKNDEIKALSLKKTEAAPAAAAKPDDQLAIAATKAFVQVKADAPADVAPKVEKLQNGFAKVSAPVGGSPVSLLLKKSASGEWVVLNSSPTTKLSAEERSKYKVPADF